jgi:Xaa-Pro aminopeptidase
MSARVERLLERLPGLEVDAMLITDLVNVRYLTGYTGSNGVALVGPELRVFLTDFRYVEQAAAEVHRSFERRQVVQDLLDAVADVVGRARRLGFEDTDLSVRQHAKLREELPASVELVGSEGVVEALRAVKESEEIASVRAAAELADQAWRSIVGLGLAGKTEREVALALEQELRRLGAERPSFDPIVASAAHGALPHAHPRDVAIEPGQLVVFDWGAVLDGYCSDCTRTVAVGEVGADERAVYEIVLRAQLAGLGAVQAGAAAQAVDAVARQVIDEAGYGEHYGHGLGHGVGIDVHEAPRLSQRSEDELRAGNVVTVEPGIYLPGRFGVRIEDLVVVTDEGCEILTGIDKALTVCE